MFCACVERDNSYHANIVRPAEEGPVGMVWIPGGEYTMGAAERDMEARRDEYPAHRVRVDGFWMDTTEVTNSEFAEFVDATGYVTIAERAPDWEELKKQLPPGTPPPADSLMIPASMVFTPVETDNLINWNQWWSWIAGANWKHPQGPGSSIEGKEDHPVVQVAWLDAKAYLDWKGYRFPTEAEWEFAARGGLTDQIYPWGEEGDLVRCANTWQGKFPENNTLQDSFFSTAPVASFKPNGYGLHDMAGNVWEWTSDWYNTNYYRECHSKGLVENPRGPKSSYDPENPYMPQRSQRGGSFLCTDQYCSSYRVSARMQSSEDTGQDHLGFRGVISHSDWLESKTSGVKSQ